MRIASSQAVAVVMIPAPPDPYSAWPSVNGRVGTMLRPLEDRGLEQSRHAQHEYVPPNKLDSRPPIRNPCCVCVQMSAMSNRTVLVDNNTWNNTHIATVGRALASSEEKAYPIMEVWGHAKSCVARWFDGVTVAAVWGCCCCGGGCCCCCCLVVLLSWH